MVAGPLVNSRLIISAGIPKEPKTYRAALLLDGFRIRGVDFSPVARKHFYKTSIPKGWHQNIINPHLPSSDRNRNRHKPLSDFEPIDMFDFSRKIANIWNIDLKLEEVLL